MSTPSISRIRSLPVCLLGEAPHWDQASSSLLYVDVPMAQLHRYYPDGDTHQTLTLKPIASGKTVTFIIPVEGEPELFLVGMGRSIGVVRWSPDDGSQAAAKPSILVSVDQDKPLNRLNDGKCDARGRLWAGTMGYEHVPGITEKEQGKLFLFSEDLEPKTCQDKIDLSNGLCWSEDRRSFYYIDTCAFSVDAFDYDESSDVISNRRKLVDYKAVGLTDDFPDGMTIDTDGNLWVANYNGAKILCIDPREGRILRTLPLPINSPTCVVFGGADYTTLYATSASHATVGLTYHQKSCGPDNGGVFAITGLGVKGFPPTKVKLSPAMVAKAKAAMA